jgi:pimeloyl-ACP methyl ester carboxylesterase
MYSVPLSRIPVLIGLLSFIASAAFGQMQVFATYKGNRLPAIALDDKALVVISDGHEERSYDLNDIEVRPTKNFGEGFVTISDVHADLNLLQQASAKERANPSAVRARYRATLTVDRKLSNCYGLLTFVNQGSIGMRLVPIGRLAAGHAKNIEIELMSDLSAIGSLHVLSNGEELRTTEHSAPYDLLKDYASLVKSVKGVPAVELLKLEETYPHVLSFDADRLATVRKRGTNKVIMILDLQANQKLSETAVAGVDDSVDDLTWISKNELVYIATVHDRGYAHALFLLDVVKGSTRKLLDEVNEVINAMPDHPEILELHSYSGGSMFMKYNVLTGKLYDYEDPDEGWFYFDAQGKARVTYDVVGARKFYKFRPTPTSRWRDIDDLVKQPGLKFNGKASEALDRVVDVHSVSPDGDTLYVSTRLGTDTFQLATFSMSQGVITKTIAKHPKYDLTTADGGFTRLLFAKNSTELVGIIAQAQKPQVIWLEPQYAAAQKSIDLAFPDHVNIPIDWAKDASTFIFYSFSDRDPGSYFLLQTKGGQLIPLLQLNQSLAGKALGQSKPISITTRDGQLIPGYVTMPPEPGPGLPPLLVLIHGGPMARDSWGFSPMNQFFATRGYVVLQVNYRGSSGYGAAFQKAGLRSRLDTVVLDDIADGVRQLITTHQVDPNRIAVMGASFGGWATYMCLAKYPELFRTGIAISAVSSWGKMLKDDRWSFDSKYAYAFWKAILQQQDYEANAKYIDPLLRVAEIRQPVFMVHGELDRVVHPTEARLMLDALKKQGTPVEAKSFVDADHSNWPIADRVEMLNEAAAFLERNLPEAAPQAAPSQAAAASEGNPAAGAVK